MDNKRLNSFNYENSFSPHQVNVFKATSYHESDGDISYENIDIEREAMKLEEKLLGSAVGKYSSDTFDFSSNYLEDIYDI